MNTVLFAVFGLFLTQPDLQDLRADLSHPGPDPLVSDCNGNDIPDFFELDCNGNGVPDDCDLDPNDPDGDGWVGRDCDGNGNLDQCDVSGILAVRSGPLAPFDNDNPQQFDVFDATEAVGLVRVTLAAVGDLDLANETIDVYVGDTFVGTTFGFGGTQCAPIPELDDLFVFAETWNAALTQAGVAVRALPSSAVSPGLCEASFIEIGVQYQTTALASDCDANGVLDRCDVRTPVVEASPQLSPLNGNQPKEYMFLVPPPAPEDGLVFLDFTALGSLNEAHRNIPVDVNGERLGIVFDTGDRDSGCITVHEDTLTVAGNAWNVLVQGQDAHVFMLPSSPVGNCGHESYVQVTLRYSGGGDCDQNGVPDACDVDPSDPDGDGLVAPDCDRDGIPDTCGKDCDGNGVPDHCDTDPNDPDGDGTVLVDCNQNHIPDDCEIAQVGEVAALEDRLTSMARVHEDILELIPDLYFFEGGRDGFRIIDPNMYGNGNEMTFLTGQFGQNINYSRGAIRNDRVNEGSRSVTNKSPGLFFLLADGLLADAFLINGNRQSTGHEVDATSWFVTANGQRFRVFLKRTFGGNGPSINQLILIPDRGILTYRTFSPWEFEDDHDLYGLEGVDHLTYLLLSRREGQPLLEEDARRISEWIAADLAIGTADCDGNGLPDNCEIAAGQVADCNRNGIPDQCDPDCNGNGVPDDCDVDPNDPDADGFVAGDCDANGRPDVCDVAVPTVPEVYIFMDPDFVQEAVTAEKLRQTIADLNLPVTSFLGAEGAAWQPVFDDADVIVIPPLLGLPAARSLSLEVRQGLREFVERGGGLLQASCTAADDLDLLDNLFAANLFVCNPPTDEVIELQPGLDGTPFEGAMQTLAATVGYRGTGGRFRPETTTFYGDGNERVVIGWPYGRGRVMWFGNSYVQVTEEVIDVTRRALEYVRPRPDVSDCDRNGIPDSCELEGADCNDNGILDVCEADCNGNGVPDDCDLDPLDPDGDGIVLTDCDEDGRPDSCGADCNANGVPDACDVDLDDPDGDGQVSPDCNEDGIPDDCGSDATTALRFDLEAGIARLERDAAALVAQIPDRFDFVGGRNGNDIRDGGQGTFNRGNMLRTSFSSGVSYTDGQIETSFAFGEGSRYATIKETGLFVLVADQIDIELFGVQGGLGTGGAGAAVGSEWERLYAGVDVSVFTKSVFGAATPSVNHIIVVPGFASGVEHSWSENTTQDRHTLTGLEEASSLIYILVARENGLRLSRDTAEMLVNGLLDAFTDTDQDCNLNGIPDVCETRDGQVADCNNNRTPDECEPDCNGNGVPDSCDLDPNDPDGDGVVLPDCDANGVPDSCPSSAIVGLRLQPTLDQLQAKRVRLKTLIPDRFDFSGGETGLSISSGAEDMFDNGNVLNTNRAIQVPYTNNQVRPGDDHWGMGSSYFTAKSDGLFVLGVTDMSVEWFSITGRLDNGGLGAVEVARLPFQVAGRDYTLFVKRVFGLNAVAVNHMMVVPGTAERITHRFSFASRDDFDRLDGLEGTTSFLYILTGGVDGARLDNADALRIAEAVVGSASVIDLDCNGNAIPDVCELVGADCNANGILDACELDCDQNGVPDECDLDPNDPDGDGFVAGDCDGDGVQDGCFVADNNAPMLIDQLAILDDNNGRITDLIPDIFFFSDGEVGTTISDGGSDMYDNGNRLKTDRFVGIPYTDANLQDGTPYFGPGSQYFTAKYPGLFVLAVDGMQIDRFEIGGNTGADGLGFVDGAVFDLMVDDRPYTLFLKRTYQASSDPSINHLILVPGTQGVRTQSFPDNTDQDTHIISGLANTEGLYYLLCSRRFANRLVFEDAVAIAETLLDLVDPPSRDCDGNGVPDSCELAAGDATDCNGNGTPDVCDIAFGASEDCDLDGVPDDCQADCDENGVPDTCDIADGAADCDSDGVLDRCDLNVIRISPMFAPLVTGSNYPLDLPAPPRADSDVRIDVTARGDLDTADALLRIRLNGVTVGDLFETGPFCPEEPATGTVVVPLQQWRDLVGDGSATIRALAIGTQFDCDGSFVQLRVSFQRNDCDMNGLPDQCDVAAGAIDCNGNQVPDDCDLLFGASTDEDGNGIPDECDCRGDINGDRVVNLDDLAALLAVFGEPAEVLPEADLDQNGAIALSDLAILLRQIGLQCS